MLAGPTDIRPDITQVKVEPGKLFIFDVEDFLQKLVVVPDADIVVN